MVIEIKRKRSERRGRKAVENVVAELLSEGTWYGETLWVK